MDFPHLGIKLAWTIFTIGWNVLKNTHDLKHKLKSNAHELIGIMFLGYVDINPNQPCRYSAFSCIWQVLSH
jgi:hypothetical protein